MLTLYRLQCLKQLPRMTVVSSFNRAYFSTDTESGDGTLVPKVDPYEFKDIPTHTGQTFEKNDYRLARFVGKKKKVNTRFAIDLIAEIPPTPVKGRYVACEGGDGPLGHPKVFINLDQPGNHSCGYCGLRFYQDHSGDDHHH